MKTIVLTDGQASRLRDMVNDKQDALFAKLQTAVADKNDGRAEGLRQSLRFWDAIDIAIRDARGHDDASSMPKFHEEDCSGVFDGNAVFSDADPGL